MCWRNVVQVVHTTCCQPCVYGCSQHILLSK